MINKMLCNEFNIDDGFRLLNSEIGNDQSFCSHHDYLLNVFVSLTRR